MHGSLIFDHAARRGVDWLTRSLRPDGSIANAASLAAAYKIPLAFALTERKESGRRVLARLNDIFQREDGHFAEADTGRRQSRHCELYEDLWLAWGARSLGELETADRVYAFIEAYFDERMGGLSSTISATPATQTFDLRSSALGGLVAIEMGADRRARGAADFTAQLLLEQPDLSQGVYLVRDARGRLVRDYSQELERYFLIRPGQARPLHYAIGLAVCLLARYAT